MHHDHAPRFALAFYTKGKYEIYRVSRQKPGILYGPILAGNTWSPTWGVIFSVFEGGAYNFGRKRRPGVVTPIILSTKMKASLAKRLLINVLNAGIPKEWAPMKPGLGSSKVALKSTDDLYKKISNRFKETMGASKIRSISRVQNKYLWERYASERFSMLTKNKGTINEKMLFHGTSSVDPEIIYDGSNSCGFDSRLGGGYYGKGAYFAEKARYSDSYAYTDSKTGHKKMFLARVLTGHAKNYGTNLAQHLTRPPPLPSSHPASPGLYDSVQGGPHSGSIMCIVYQVSKAYPEYLISYT